MADTDMALVINEIHALGDKLGPSLTQIAIRAERYDSGCSIVAGVGLVVLACFLFRASKRIFQNTDEDLAMLGFAPGIGAAIAIVVGAILLLDTPNLIGWFDPEAAIALHLMSKL